MDVYQRRRLVALSVVAAVFIALVLLIRSCGGDDEDPTTLTSTAPTTGVGGVTALSQEDFIGQGDSICLEANTTLASLDSDDPEQAAVDTAEVLAGELSSLQSLTLAPGEQGEKKLENFLNGLEQQVQAYDDLVTATERGDETAAAEIQTTIEESASATEQAARRFGFEACGDLSQVSESPEGEESTGEETEADTGGTVAPVTPTTTTPVAPTTTTPVAPVDGGGATPDTAPPADTGTDTGGSSSGGLTP